MSTKVSPIYSDLASDEDIGEIVTLYAEEMPGRAAQLQAELDRRNWEKLRILTHQIKGSAGSHGFAPVSAAAARCHELLATAQSGAEQAEEEFIEAIKQLIELCLRVTGDCEPGC